MNENWDDKYAERSIRAMIYPPYANAQFRNVEITSFQEFK
jgi:hypothetical protein